MGFRRGGEDSGEGYGDGGYDRGYDGAASDAYPPSGYRPRPRPPRPGGWNAPAGYAEPVWDGDGRRMRGAGGRADGRRATGREPREGRRDGKAQGAGRKHRGGQAGQCHYNPATGQQHCG